MSARKVIAGPQSRVLLFFLAPVPQGLIIQSTFSVSCNVRTCPNDMAFTVKG